MTAKEFLQSRQGKRMKNAFDEPFILECKPGLSELEIEALRQQRAVSDELAELLSFTRGFTAPDGEEVDFVGEPFGLEGIFRHPIALKHDGAGNFWVIDAASETPDRIYFACHDPAVALVFAQNYTDFLQQILGNIRLGKEDAVYDKCYAIWKRKAAKTLAETQKRDAQLNAFAQTLEPGHLLIDLRKAKNGDGFAWGQLLNKRQPVPPTRHPTAELWAYKPPAALKPWWKFW